MRHPLASLLMLVAALCILPAAAGAQPLAIYDPFDGNGIDATKWRGTESASSLTIVSTDAHRGIVDDRLRLALTTHGTASSDTGLAGEARNRVLLNHAELADGTPAITVMRSNIIMVRAVAQDCAASDVSTTTLAGMFGSFFNDGTATPNPSDFTGDVLAVIDLRRDSRSGRTINAALARCTNSSCSQANILTSAVFAKSWSNGEAVTVTIRWQPGQNRFSFVATSAAGSETKLLTYALSDSDPAKSFLKDLRVNNAIPHCATPVRAAVDARFNNMAINATAVDAID